MPEPHDEEDTCPSRSRSKATGRPTAAQKEFRDSTTAARTAAPTVVRMAALTAVPMVAPTAVPMVARMAALTAVPTAAPASGSASTTP